MLSILSKIYVFKLIYLRTGEVISNVCKEMYKSLHILNMIVYMF